MVASTPSGDSMRKDDLMKAMIWQLPTFFIVLSLLWGCGAGRANQNFAVDAVGLPAWVENETSHQVSEENNLDKVTANRFGYNGGPQSSQGGWTQRVVAKDELMRLNEEDPELSYSISKQILARLNVRAPYYIAEDIRNQRPIKVPNDFSLYKNWTPLPRMIPEVSTLPKFILIVKDIPFLGWYEDGRLAGDSPVCIGKSDGWTRAGIYRVRDKDIDHISGSYANAYGQPAPMPWALRIYEHVWSHAGDITGGYCSHGCINLPLMPAQQLFSWADHGTVVLVVESLRNLQTVFEHNRSNCVLYAGQCQGKEASKS